MASQNTSARLQCTKVPRFSVQDALVTIQMDISQDGCRLALSWWDCNTIDTFIDLFALQKHPGFQDLSLLMTSQPYFSKKFTKIDGSKRPPRRLVCLLDDSVFVTCCVNTIESYDTKHGRLVNRRQYTGEAICMTTTRDGRVYVGLSDSNDVIVFDWRLNQIKSIKLGGNFRPWNMTVNSNKLFIITAGTHGRVLMYDINGRDIEYEFKEPNQQYSNARSITVSEENRLIYMLWGGDWRKYVVVIYPFPGGQSSLSGCHFLASFYVSDDSCQIRVNSLVNRLFVVTNQTGEVYEYDTYDIINLENLLTLIELLISEDECQTLLNYFKVPAEKAKTIQNSDEPSKTLLQHLKEKGRISAGDISLLLTACNRQGIIQVAEAWTNYQKYISQMAEKEKKDLISRLKESDNERQQLTVKLETTKEKMRQLNKRLEAKVKEEQQLTTTLEMTEEENIELSTRLTASDDERKQLRGRLETAEEEKSQLAARLTTTEKERQQLSNRLSGTEKTLQDHYDEDKRMKRIVEENQKELEETKSNLRAAKDDLIQAQLRYAKESMALQEVLEQTREDLTEQAVSPTDSVEQVVTFPKGNETSDVSPQLAALAADFGRLMVDIAEDLTLDDTLKLAFLFKLPDSEKDMLRRISLIQTPGLTLVDFLKTRNIINMYDVTNLQKGLMHLQLHRTKEKYVDPYQEKIDPFQFEENRSPDLDDWPVEEAESPKASKSSDSQESQWAEQSEEPQNEGGEDNLTERIGTEENPRQRQDIQNMQIKEPYIEQKINDEGGTITLMGVYFSIPEEALSGDHVIAMTVIDDPDVLLPGTPQRGRMTPLIKLEPDGLKLNKPARLIIPYSAIVPKPGGHSAIIFSGQSAQGESQKGHITWTEESSLKCEQEQEKITLYINTLSYVFVNLESEEMAQKHIFRVVPFIDGILDAKDDVIITVCFCKDSDLEYQSLIDDFKSKLVFRDYMTFQVSRSLHEGKDGVSDLALTMSPQRDSYYLTEGEATKFVDVDHLCAASRVSLLFRLQRDKRQDDEVVDVKLQVSQGENNQINLIIQSKVKNILLSRANQLALSQGLPKDKEKKWSLERNYSSCLQMNNMQIQISRSSGLIGPHISFQKR